MKRKITLKFKKSLAIFAALTVALPTCYLASKTAQISIQLNLQNNNNPEPPEGEIPPEALNVVDGVLKGFVPGFTIDDLIKGQYTTLHIPSGVKRIDNLAFANCFSEQTSFKLTNLILNPDLEEIGQGAFLNDWGFLCSMESVGIANCDSLTRVEAEAFSGCSGITGELTFGKNLTFIGNSAFRYCSSLQRITIPKTLEKVEAMAFNNCQGLAYFDFSALDRIPPWMYEPNQLIFYASFDDGGEMWINAEHNTIDEWKDVIYNRLEVAQNVHVNCAKSTKSYPAGEDYFFEKTYDSGQTILSKVKNIGILDINLIIIPDDITKIAKGAFDDFRGKQDWTRQIILNDSLAEIEESAFENCSWLTGNFTIPKNIQTIGKNAFKGCTGLKGVVSLPADINLESSQSAFEGCTGITGVKFNNTGDIQLPTRLFADCINLSCIDFTELTRNTDTCKITVSDECKPDEPKTFPFYNINPTGEVILQYASNEINWGDYYDQFKKVFNIDDEKQEDTKNIFYREWRRINYDDIEEVDVANWLLTAHPMDAEQEASRSDPAKPMPFREELDLSIKNQTQMIGLKDNVLKYIKTHHGTDEIVYDTLQLPTNILSINDGAFRANFTHKLDMWSTTLLPKFWFVNFNNGLQSIGNYAFADNPGISGMFKFPESLRSIGDYAFAQATEMRGSLQLPENIEHIGAGAFSNCIRINNTNLVLPKSLDSIGANAFAGINMGHKESRQLAKTETGTIIFKGWIDHLQNYAFCGINGLRTIDLTALGKPTKTPNWSKNAFNIPVLKTDNAKIIVSKDSDPDAWKTLLTEHGLNENWDVVCQE